ncbi:TonB-dependent receptor [Chitinophaga sp. XS-30]|uniref:TonB-dependent receptor n=1 Tax=Chitinophaga sp. XS-30 TaxID=2604421 RepID=UPI0011DE0B0B|nr:TonB-dependent receptor [Chitinophaga sp. XS-30]QEH40720.1 TonB-dependent receptor [Chitinophaga sp. XS-30]
MKFFSRTKPRYRLWQRLLLLVCLFTGSHLYAQQSALSKKISIRFTGESMTAALEKVGKQVELKLAFNAANTNGYKAPVTEYTNKTLEQVLQGLLQNTSLSFREANGYIIISKENSAPAAPVRAKGRVTGKVIDEEQRQPVSGANIRIGNSGGVTDTNGHFSITLPAGNYTAIISYVGYAYMEIPDVTVKDDSTSTLDFVLQKDKRQLGEVTVRADRVITTNDRQLIEEIRSARGIASGISSEQITISVDRSASEVARRVSGVTLQDGFISIRGMTPRYNPVYLNNAFLPSTDPNKRAFNFDLLPSSVIDRMIVYKSPAPELPADFAGGVVKVYTKKSVPIRRLEISLNAQYRTGNKFFDDHVQAGSGKYDWLGFDDGTRAMPVNMPRNPYGMIILEDVPSVPSAYLTPNAAITDALLARSVKSWNLSKKYHPADLQGDATYYTYANIGKLKLNSVTVGRYENQRSFYHSNTARSANMYRDTVFPAPGVALTPLTLPGFRVGYDSVYSSSVRLAAMQHFSLIINDRNEITAMGLMNRSTKQVLQINTVNEWFTSEAASLFIRRMENAYNRQDLYMGMLGGSHKTGNEKHLLEWTASYSRGIMKDPNQFSNTYHPDDASITGDVAGLGKFVPTDKTTWRLNAATRKNTVVGRFTDGEGDEQRWQGNIDYTLTPLQQKKDFLLRAGAFVESRRKRYFYSALAYKNFPELGFSASPWDNLGDSLLYALQTKNLRMYTNVQEVGLGGAQTNGYTATFDNLAGYLASNLPVHFRWPMGKRPMMKLDIYGGLRVEYSKRVVLDTKGRQLLEEYLPNSAGQQVLVGTAPPTHQYFWLPSINATLHLNDHWQLRASYGKTLNRPELRELSPFVTYNPSDGFTYIGKPTLHDARIDNYDLRLEWYPAPGEAMSAGFYHKYIQQPIEETMANTNTGVPGFTHSNMPFARIYGMELEIRKQLGFLGGDVFEHMGLIVNACYNFTEASNQALMVDAPEHLNYYPGGEKRAFTGAAPWILNAGLFYDHKASGSRISLQYNVLAERIITNTSGGRDVELEPPMIERSRHLLDLSILQKINKRISVRLAAQNLLNAAIRHYVDNDFNKKFNTDPTYFEWTIHGPIRTEYKKYIRGDYYIRDYKPGVYYTLGFQFNL